MHKKEMIHPSIGGEEDKGIACLPKETPQTESAYVQAMCTRSMYKVCTMAAHHALKVLTGPLCIPRCSVQDDHLKVSLYNRRAFPHNGSQLMLCNRHIAVHNSCCAIAA